MVTPGLHFILFYEYVEDMLERRPPHREAHLGHIAQAKEAGRIVMAGPLGDPPRGAAIVFAGEAENEIEPFAVADPYVQAGLVTARRVERWNVV